ncbi:MAG: HAMP domain-containing sensor histidine kinase [Pseudomonadota bacterium]
MPSLRNKILNAYAFSKLIMLGFAAVMFVDLYYLNRQIENGQAVTDFREAVLEMRRDEKNLFLYRDPASIEQVLQQAANAEAVLASGRSAFVALAGAPSYRQIELMLRTYRAEFERYPGLSPAQQQQARDNMRKLGHALSELSDEMSRRERQLFAEVTRRAGLTLLLTFAAVVALGLAGGLFLVRHVVRPLRQLEQGLLAIDAGQARELALPSRDKEIRSFVEAFNAMLKHMRQQQDQAKRNEKMAALGVLVSGVAHELNNPLSNISTSAQLLLEEGASADAETRQLWLEQIDSETERARRIVRRLLDSVRQPKLHKVRLPLVDLIQSSLELVHRQLPPQVHVCVGAMAEIVIEVDRERLNQVFINLIKNAADAGASRIELSATLARWEDGYAESGHLEGDPTILRQTARAVRITVEDDGPGIPAELLAHIFDPFVTTHASGEGTGLGLYLVEEIVSEHSGCIVVDSPAGGGTRFAIWLPLNDEEAA